MSITAAVPELLLVSWHLDRICDLVKHDGKLSYFPPAQQNDQTGKKKKTNRSYMLHVVYGVSVCLSILLNLLHSRPETTFADARSERPVRTTFIHCSCVFIPPHPDCLQLQLLLLWWLKWKNYSQTAVPLSCRFKQPLCQIQIHNGYRAVIFAWSRLYG